MWFLNMLERGKKGLKYDIPNEVRLFNIKKWMKKPNAIPRKPAINPSIIYMNLKILIEKPIL